MGEKEKTDPHLSGFRTLYLFLMEKISLRQNRVGWVHHRGTTTQLPAYQESLLETPTSFIRILFSWFDPTQSGLRFQLL
jgi:hypothetical protein